MPPGGVLGSVEDERAGDHLARDARHPEPRVLGRDVADRGEELPAVARGGVPAPARDRLGVDAEIGLPVAELDGDADLDALAARAARAPARVLGEAALERREALCELEGARLLGRPAAAGELPRV